MTKEFLDKLFERTSLVFISGLLLFLLGAMGGITIGTFSIQITEVVWRVIISLAGTSLIGFGLFFQWKESSEETKAQGNTSSNTSSSPIRFVQWNIDDFVEKISTAKDIRMITVSNYDLVSGISEQLKNFLRQGGQIRCIYVRVFA